MKTLVQEHVDKILYCNKYCFFFPSMLLAGDTSQKVSVHIHLC